MKKVYRACGVVGAMMLVAALLYGGYGYVKNLPRDTGLELAPDNNSSLDSINPFERIAAARACGEQYGAKK